MNITVGKSEEVSAILANILETFDYLPFDYQLSCGLMYHANVVGHENLRLPFK